MGQPAPDDTPTGDHLQIGQPVHRLRDLPRRGRLVALLCALALLIAPALAFTWAAPDWSPAGDTALMGLRSLDVGTERTPLTGQPSTSGHYTEQGGRHADHPGPVHFFLMAPTIRVLGPPLGMLSVSVFITAGSVLLIAWAAFRQLGPAPGLWAAVILSGITFTTGATSLIYPVSSSISGYPLFCSTVLLWCLFCGDIRLLPLATAVVSFAAQQHLSVLPALMLATLVGVVGLAAHAVRRGWLRPPERRRLIPWVGGSAALGLVLWAPVIIDQLTGRPGNITRIARFAGDGSRPSVGLRSAVGQVAHVLGVPPLLGRTRLNGGALLTSPNVLTWLTATITVSLIAVLWFRWRRSQPRLAGLCVLAGVLSVAGLVNGASVPAGIEQGRLSLYHWTFALTFFAAMALGIGAIQAAQRTRLVHRIPARAPGVLVAVALTAMVVPAVVNPSLDRRTNLLSTAGSRVPRSGVVGLADDVMAEAEPLGSHPVLLERGGSVFAGIGPGIAFELTDRGLPLRHRASLDWFVHEDRLADAETVTGGLVVVVDDGRTALDIPGEVIAETTVGQILSDDSTAALEALTSQMEDTAEIRFGPQVAAGVPQLSAEVLAELEEGERAAYQRAFALAKADPPTDEAQANMFFRLGTLTTKPRRALVEPELIEFLIDHPLEQPRLDPDHLQTLASEMPDGWSAGKNFAVRVHRLTRDQVLDFAYPTEL